MRKFTNGLLVLSLCFGVSAVAGCENGPLAIDGSFSLVNRAKTSTLKVVLGGDLLIMRSTQATVDAIHHVDIILKTSALEQKQSLTKAQLTGEGSTGYVFIADTGNHRILKVSPTGTITTLAGSGVAGMEDGTGTAAKFNNPKGLAVDSNGSVYVADFTNNRIRKISRAGQVITVAGQTSFGLVNGVGGAAQFCGPTGVAVTPTGVIVVADSFNHVIRKIQ